MKTTHMIKVSCPECMYGPICVFRSRVQEVMGNIADELKPEGSTFDDPPVIEEIYIHSCALERRE